MLRKTFSLLMLTLLLGSVAHAQLPVWPLVTGFEQSGTGFDPNTTTPHQFIDWTVGSPSYTTMASPAESNRVGPAQAGINGCNELVFFTLHNGELTEALAELQVFTQAGIQLPLAGGEMKASAGDDEVQIIRRPGFPNQWFVVYALAPTVFQTHPGYAACNLAYSLIEVNTTTAAYVLDGGGVPIQDRVILDGGIAYQYFNGKATSRVSVTAGANHDIYAQRRSQIFGNNNSVSATFQIDRFIVNSSDAITYQASSNVETGYSWYLMAAGSPIELAPDESRLAVMARTQNNSEQEIYIFDVSTPTSLSSVPVDVITIDELEIEFPTAPLPLTGLYHQALEFDATTTTGFEWLRNFERKMSGLEFGPNGQYLYICGGGYENGGSSNLTYLVQIDLNATVNSDHPCRIQVETSDPLDSYDNTTGEGPGWTGIDSSALWDFHSLSKIQSCYDNNFYFTKGRSNQLWVLPNPGLQMAMDFVPQSVDLSTGLSPNVPTDGFVLYMPDQIDGFDYSISNYTGISFNVSNQSLCTCDTLTMDVINANTLDTLTTFFITDCPQVLNVCVENGQSYNFVGSNGIVFQNAISAGSLVYPVGNNVFNFGNGNAVSAGFTTVTNALVSTNEVWDGKYYIPDGMVVVVDGAELDLTNCDLVFGTCAGIDFINQGNLRANNSVFRPCEIDAAWRGLRFIGTSEHDHIINESTFKNAEVALYFTQASDGVVSNNLFSNCNHGVYATSNTNFNHPISGNRFVTDNFTPTFDICYPFIDLSMTYGVRAIISNFVSEISHNEFVYAKETEPGIAGISSIGIDLERSGGLVSENTFTNIRNAISLNDVAYSTFIDNNEIEFNNDFVIYTTSPSTPAGGVAIYNGSGVAIEVNGNEINNHQFGLTSYGVYSENGTNLSVAGNSIDNFRNGIHMVDARGVEVTNNVLTEIAISGIFLSAGDGDYQNFITCNDVTMQYHAGTGIQLQNTNSFTRVTSNCIKDSYLALYAGTGSGSTIPYIRNNYLYNYYFGLYNIGHIGNIGTGADPGLNTLWSNDNAATDIFSTTTIQVADNFGMFNISSPQVQITSNNPYHSTASCGHQIFNMPSQGNLNTSFLCNNEIAAQGKLMVNGGTSTLNPNYLDLIQSDGIELLDAIALIKIYDYADLPFTTQLISDLGLSSSEAALVRFELHLKNIDYVQAELALNAFVPVTDEEGLYQAVHVLKLKQLQGGTLTDLEINFLNDIVDQETDISNYAVSVLASATRNHRVRNYDEIEELVLESDFETRRIESDLIDMQLSPNPVEDILNIEFIANNASEENMIHIYTISGESLYSESLTLVNGETSVDVQSLAQGMYIITLSNDGRVLSTSRFVKK